jgi:tartrate-resistant acid phosphatase type 5
MPLSRRDFVRTLFVASQTALASHLLADNLPVPDPTDKSLTFAVIGDWGRWGRTDQMQVATQMGVACQEAAASFIISLGDNFYDYGVTSVNDPLWEESFERVYIAQSLQAPWYAILGNHDYCGNCDAQLDYAKTHPRWNMPARYYSQVHDIGPATKLEIFYIDTNPFVVAYKTDSRMSKNVLTQDSAAQLRWLEKGLAASTAQWKLVMGHHPIYSSGLAHGNQPELIEQLLPLLQKYKVQAYFAGHDHDLEHLKVGDLDLIVSGAGSEYRPMKTPATSPFSRAISGFVMAAIDTHKLQVRFIDNLGHLLYTTSSPRV